MENTTKFNALAIVSFTSGIIVVASLGLYYGLARFLFRLADGISFDYMSRLPIVLLEMSVPVRNIFAPLAVLTGFFGLREIKKRQVMMQRGKALAWIGMLLGGVWIILGILGSIIFFLVKILI